MYALCTTNLKFKSFFLTRKKLQRNLNRIKTENVKKNLKNLQNLKETWFVVFELQVFLSNQLVMYICMYACIWVLFVLFLNIDIFIINLYLSIIIPLYTNCLYKQQQLQLHNCDDNNSKKSAIKNIYKQISLEVNRQKSARKNEQKKKRSSSTAETS